MVLGRHGVPRVSRLISLYYPDSTQFGSDILPSKAEDICGCGMNIIEVSNLSKSYHLGQTGYKTIREAIMSLAFHSNNSHQSIWALSNVSFEVKQGEAFGIIGKNGSGKSTLLKILSRVTAQTSGSARVYGRVGSLLEIGTGFHPELTGRENIYLNGAILGMTRKDTNRKFDEIVNFSGMEKFLDTPVKRYSSGMLVRLGFSVAAHLDSEVMLVDEVLAVGDWEFQQKCLAKMRSLIAEGRTLLFVSHNMAIVSELCQRGILLEGGRIKIQGEIKSVVELYLEPSINVTG